jgi:DNA invertase Pin-like site-specific DNA recombinase
MASDAVIYVRISKDREGAGLGVARQEKDCRELAARLGLTVTHVYVDNDISAYSGKPRPDYNQMLAGIRDGSITRVLAWHTDRIHRNPRELEDYIDASELHGCTTDGVKAGPLDLATPGGQAVARTLCAWAKYESAVKSVRLRAWTKQRAENGHTHGGRRPYGWMPDRIHLDPLEHAVKMDIVARLMAGESLRSISQDLRDRNTPTVTAGSWDRTMIRNMLLSPRQAGFRTHKGETVAKGDWEPALDEDAWHALCSVLTDPDRRTVNSSARISLLSRLARCGECDEPVATKYNGRRHYRCENCGLWRRQEPIDDYVSGYMVGLLETIDEEPDPGIDQLAVARVKALQARIKATQRAFSADDSMTPDDLLEVLRPLKARLEKAQAAAVPPRRSALLKGATGPDAATSWARLKLDQKRALIGELINVRLLRVAGGTAQFDRASVPITRR